MYWAAHNNLVPVYNARAGAQPAGILDEAPSCMLEWPALSLLARVPEHSAHFMSAMSGGSPVVVNDYLFFTGEDWVTGIGYPLRGEFDLSSFILAADLLGDALVARNRSAACEHVDMFVVAPALPAHAVLELGGEMGEEDRFYILPAGTDVPAPLRRLARKAGESLRVEEGAEFGAAHRRLWSEMLAKTDMRPNVREMYAKTGRLMQAGVPGVSFLNALDASGNLAASLLIDTSPEKFLSYIIGAHSRRHYTPYATDLLFAHMLAKARRMGKEYIHLGLGVNEGILRFKKKWGAQEDLPFVSAHWEHRENAASVKQNISGLLQNLGKSGGVSKQQLFDSMPEQRTLAMLWELEKNGKKSWICGSAHFFYYSFTLHFEKLFNEVDNVIFEGPMDEESMALFARSGQTRQPQDAALLDMLTARELCALKCMVEGPQNPMLRRLNGEKKVKPVDVEHYLTAYRPWYAFFSLWTAFLERRGWAQSVDLDAWNLAHDMGKSIIAMETHEEQLASLESVPAERIIDFFRHCRKWPAYSRNNLRSYLLGDLGGMYGTSTEFPTRGVHTVFNVRDLRFTERMLPFVEQGGCIAFVGSAHMLGMRDLLRREGVKVGRVWPGRWHRLKCDVIKKINGSKSDFG